MLNVSGQFGSAMLNVSGQFGSAMLNVSGQFGSAMLNVSGQFGSAIGVYVLVALTANHTPFRGFDHVWIVQARLGLAAAAVLLTRSRHRTADLTANHPQPKGAR